MNQPVNEMWMLTSCSPPWTPSLTLQVPEDRLWFNEIQTYSCNQHPHNQLKFGRFVGISFDYLLEPGFSGRLVIFDCNSWRSRCWEHLINQGMFFNCSRTKSKNSVFFWDWNCLQKHTQLLCHTRLVYVDELSHQPGFLWKKGGIPIIFTTYLPHSDDAVLFWEICCVTKHFGQKQTKQFDRPKIIIVKDRSSWQLFGSRCIPLGPFRFYQPTR